eukprot:TRINITY_DN33133_c0_g1_i1.p1 TRINITY_DN33133_c0_g1~~TRINITY_DN33133_c0_g1_i1.p1  ORF type:complete len:308 (-),score=56.16 TRINITY_DN33133_c0_g1_i1:77-973(-)
MAVQLQGMHKQLDVLAPGWPIDLAVSRFLQVERTSWKVQERRHADAAAVVDLVIAHCREDLSWLAASAPRDALPERSRLFVIEKCGEVTPLGRLGRWSAAAEVLLAPDARELRGNEHAGYVAHILRRYDDLAEFTIFLHGDPAQHFNWDFFQTVMRSMNAGTYAIPVLPLNAVRYQKLWTPCLGALAKQIFRGNLTREGFQAYCCSQFVASRRAIRRRSRDFYARLRVLAGGGGSGSEAEEGGPSLRRRPRAPGSCGDPGAGHLAVGFALEFFWQVVLGEPEAQPSATDHCNKPITTS